MKKKIFIFTRLKKKKFFQLEPDLSGFALTADGLLDERNLSEKEKVLLALKLPRCPLPSHTNQVAVSICLRLDGCKIRRGHEEEAWLQSHPSRQSQSASGELLCLKYGCCCKGPLGKKKPNKKTTSLLAAGQAPCSTCSSFCLQLRC